MHVETFVTLWDLFKTKKYFFTFFYPFSGIFFQPSLAPKLLKISVYELALKNWAMNMHFNPIPIL